MLSVTELLYLFLLLPAIPTLLALPSALFSAILRGNMDTKPHQIPLPITLPGLSVMTQYMRRHLLRVFRMMHLVDFRAFSADEHPVLTAMHHLGLLRSLHLVVVCAFSIVLMFLFTPDRFPVRIGEQVLLSPL